MNEKERDEKTNVPLTNVERSLVAAKELKEAKQRELDAAENPYPHGLRD